VIVFLSGNCTDLVGELQGLGKVLRFESLLKPFHSVHFLNLPPIHMKKQIIYL
jgi:hypothetical protein